MGNLFVSHIPASFRVYRACGVFTCPSLSVNQPLNRMGVRCTFVIGCWAKKHSYTLFLFRKQRNALDATQRR